VLAACGYSMRDSLFEFASALGTVGLSVGVTSPDMPDIALWAEIIAMFLGRLEFMAVIVSAIKLGETWVASLLECLREKRYRVKS
jgi:trk system potassium uptake protein